MAATTKPKEFREYINLKIRENNGDNVVEMLEQARLALLKKRFLRVCTDEEIDIAFDFKGRHNQWKGKIFPAFKLAMERKKKLNDYAVQRYDTHITFIPKEEEDEGEVDENKEEDEKDGGEVDENKDKDEKEDEDGEGEKEDSEEEEGENEGESIGKGDVGEENKDLETEKDEDETSSEEETGEGEEKTSYKNEDDLSSEGETEEGDEKTSDKDEEEGDENAEDDKDGKEEEEDEKEG
ncbi:hypothetical protein Ddye_002477 [Dipteronia dyeriana]|uniref:Uncharacterized protein n=1 Tax=Dipteronia dyeriana TaxID=168575 RepID=A0AAD9XR57_9ROSI|nr:hypothetical protein Ddye_002477 [Dipteronia dyeriana]